MPTVARAMASQAAHEAAAQVCSANGAMTQLPAGDAPDPGIHLDHCPFCLPHAGSFGLPPTSGMAILLAQPAAFEPFLFLQGPRQLDTWTNARSRAPPAGS
jgi:hypothetical protein